MVNFIIMTDEQFPLRDVTCHDHVASEQPWEIKLFACLKAFCDTAIYELGEKTPGVHTLSDLMIIYDHHGHLRPSNHTNVVFNLFLYSACTICPSGMLAMVK
jgi:hypothetical protein